MSKKLFRPSSTSIGVNCDAGISLTWDLPSTSSPSARRGTAGHMGVELLLAGKPLPKSVMVDGEEIEFDDDLIDAVNLCADFAEGLRADSDLFHAEKRLSLNWYYAPEPPPLPVEGTSDVVSFNAARRMLTIADHKFGVHPVLPISDQLLTYAAMALGLFESEMPVHIRTVVLQPADVAQPIKVHTMLISELIEWVRDVLHPALVRIGAGSTNENPGEWCRWCNRAGDCRSLQSRALEIAQASFDDGVPSPGGFSDEELGAILDKAEMVEQWIKAVRGEVSHRIDTGRAVPGWKLVAKRANRKWTNAEDVRQLLAHDRYTELMIDEVFTTPELRSPAQIEKALKKRGISTQIVDDHTTREVSGTTLVRDGDPREQVVRLTADVIFADD